MKALVLMDVAETCHGCGIDSHECPFGLDKSKCADAVIAAREYIDSKIQTAMEMSKKERGGK